MLCPVASDVVWRAQMLAQLAVLMCAFGCSELRAKRRRRRVAPLPVGFSTPRPTSNDLASEGAAFERAGDAEKARTAYTQALALDPRAILPLSRLGHLYRNAGRPEVAILYLKRATASHPEHAGPRALLEELENTVDWTDIDVPILDDDALEAGPLILARSRPGTPRC